jgi:hypothetical protein
VRRVRFAVAARPLCGCGASALRVRRVRFGASRADLPRGHGASAAARNGRIPPVARAVRLLRGPAAPIARARRVRARRVRALRACSAGPHRAPPPGAAQWGPRPARRQAKDRRHAPPEAAASAARPHGGMARVCVEGRAVRPVSDTRYRRGPLPGHAPGPEACGGWPAPPGPRSTADNGPWPPSSPRPRRRLHCRRRRGETADPGAPPLSPTSSRSLCCSMLKPGPGMASRQRWPAPGPSCWATARRQHLRSRTKAGWHMCVCACVRACPRVCPRARACVRDGKDHLFDAKRHGPRTSVYRGPPPPARGRPDAQGAHLGEGVLLEPWAGTRHARAARHAPAQAPTLGTHSGETARTGTHETARK